MVDKFNRQMYLLFTLAELRRGRTAEDLQQDLETVLGVSVSVRTIYRDINELSLTFPITEEVRNGKAYYFMLDRFRLDDVQFTFKELIALMLLQSMLDNLGSDPVIEAGKQLTERFIAKLTPSQQQFLKGLYDYFRVEMPGNWGNKSDLLQLFFEAAFGQQEVEIEYYSFHSDEVMTRIIHPYTIYYRQQYYIVAWCTERKEIREFRLDRVQAARVLDSGFTPDPGFDYESYSKNCWEALKGKASYDVVLRFSPEYSRFIREYHGLRADSLCDLPDGRLEFRKAVSMLDEILPWVISHGPEVEVVAPPELREQVVDTVTRHARQLGLL
ncbi:MAG: WYL domain-containing transcriptional regulator [Firmicutes bacterium]|nr:WYL domain-containing transcriptional regulator [Bacillota bacterium]